MNTIYGQIINVLEIHGPLLSDELIQKLISTHDIVAKTARTRIKRAVDKGYILASPVSFQHNKKLYFLKKQSIKSKVTQIMTAIDSPESNVFNALVLENGFLFWDEFCKLTSCSDAYIHGKKSIDQVAKNLVDLNVIKVVNEYSITNKYVTFNPEYIATQLSGNHLELRRRNLNLNHIILDELMSWLERISLVGWGSSRSSEYGELSIFNHYPFDAVGISYIWGLYRTNKEDSLYKPSKEKAGSPVLVDCIVHRETRIYDIAAFIKRVDNVNGPINQANNPYFKILPIFFVKFIDRDAHDLAKQKGVIIISIREVFSNNIIDVLDKMIKLSTKDITLDSLEEILETMQLPSSLPDEKGKKRENAFDGEFNNLKGIVFNFLIAYMFSKLGYGQQLIGTIYKGHIGNESDELTCECDLTARTSRNDIEIICEVKGYSSNNKVKLGENMDDKDSVKRFFERTWRIIQSQGDKDRMSYIPLFITSSEFEDDAIEYMDKRFGRKLKDKVDLLNNNFPKKLYYGKKDLIELSNNLESGKEIRRILKEYFS